jgi:hypothetical protein
MSSGSRSSGSRGSERSWKWWASHVVTPLLVALIGAIAFLYGTRPEGSNSEPRGAITFPRDGATVSQVFTAEGTLADVPDDLHVWLAAQVGELLFPKEPEIANEPHWLDESIEAGNPPGGAFSLVLLTVGAKGQRQIEAWLKRGRATGKFAGLEAIVESTKIDAASQLSLPKIFRP